MERRTLQTSILTFYNTILVYSENTNPVYLEKRFQVGEVGASIGLMERGYFKWISFFAATANTFSM